MADFIQQSCQKISLKLKELTQRFVTVQQALHTANNPQIYGDLLAESIELATASESLEEQLIDKFDLRKRQEIAQKLNLQYLGKFSPEGIAVGIKKNKNDPPQSEWNVFINKDGTYFVEQSFIHAGNFLEGIAACQDERDKSYFLTSKKTVWNDEYLVSASDFSEGVAVANRGTEKGGFHFYAADGTAIPIKVTPEIFYTMKGMSEGWLAIASRDLNHAFINIAGERLVVKGLPGGPVEGISAFSSICPFQDQVALVRYRKKYYIINTDGTLLLPKGFKDLGSFSDGLAPVKENGKCYFINKKGEQAFNFQFEEAREFSEGIACVVQNGEIKFLRTNGTFIPLEKPLQRADVISLSNFEDGVVRIPHKALSDIFIDYRGRQVFKPKFQL